MIKKVGFFLGLSILLLSGCGGGGSSKGENSIKDKISNKKYVVIMKNMPSDICESKDFKNALTSKGFTGIVTQETSNDAVSCETYGKRNDGRECDIADYRDYDYAGSGDVNCVIGFDGMKNDRQEKYIESIDMFDAVETTLIEMH